MKKLNLCLLIVNLSSILTCKAFHAALSYLHPSVEIDKGNRAKKVGKGLELFDNSLCVKNLNSSVSGTNLTSKFLW